MRVPRVSSVFSCLFLLPIGWAPLQLRVGAMALAASPHCSGSCFKRFIPKWQPLLSRWGLKSYLHRSGGRIESLLLISASGTARRRLCLVDRMALVQAAGGQSPPSPLLLEPLRMSPLPSRPLWAGPWQLTNALIL